MTKYIAGAGSKKKKKRNPRPLPPPPPVIVQPPSQPGASDDPNSLFSKSSVRIIDLLSEGEIEGFVETEEEKSIFLDDTAIMNADNTTNFVFDNFEFREGTQAQTYIPGFPAAESVVPVNSAVGDAIGNTVVRTITNSNVDRLIVRVVIPQLFVINNGLKATTMKYEIDVQPNGGSYVNQVSATVQGKCTSAYERSHDITLTGSAPWNIRLKRTEGVNDGSTNFRQLTFGGLTEVVDGKLRYPLSALVGLRFEATQFQEVPTRSYEIKGIKVQIPTNATVNATNGRLSYSGVWNGQFQTAWCADPAWIMRDLITSARYGLGRFVTTAQLDKWSLYEISKYCNELVNDGQGSTEPRFLCNVYMQSRDEAYNVIQDFASVFRGMAYWSAGQIAFSQDAPSDPAALFNNANVINGDFTYEGSSLKSRHTVALVTWNDPENNYEQQVEYVSDEDAIVKYGLIETRLAAFGCTSRGQANRAGRWLLYQEQNETQTVSFQVGLDGAIVRPGQIIKIMDRVRAGARKAGRVASYSGTTLTIDEGIITTPGDTVSVVLPDGTIEQRTIDSGSVGDKTITVDTTFSQTPAADTVYVIETSSLVAQLFRVLSVVEDSELFTIVALEHNTSKYDFVEDGLTLQQRDITDLNQPPAAPQGLSVDERLVEAGNRVTTEVEIAWNNVPNAVSYQVTFKTANSASFQSVGSTRYNSITLLTDETGKFTFRVTGISSIGKRSAPSDVVVNIAGNTAAPTAVQGLSMIPVNGQAKLTWTQSTELDVRVGGYVLLRHSPLLTGVTWANSTSISEQIAGSATEAFADLKEGTYSAKFVDSGGRQSLTATLIEFTKPDLDNLETINTQTEHPNFTGTKTRLTVDTSLNELILTETGSETAAVGDIVAEDGTKILLEDGSLLQQQGNNALNTTGVYEFANNPIALSDVFSLQLESILKVRSFFPYSQRIDDEADFDAITDFDGTTPQDTDAKLYIRTTQDNPAGESPTYTSWRQYNNAQFKARGYELKLEVDAGSGSAQTSLNPQGGIASTGTTQIAVQELKVTSNLPYRTITNNVTTSTSADVAVTYDNKFYATPAVGIQFTTQATGDYYVISSSSATGFSVSVYNSSNAPVARTVTWTATGYGKN